MGQHADVLPAACLIQCLRSNMSSYSCVHSCNCMHSEWGPLAHDAYACTECTQCSTPHLHCLAACRRSGTSAQQQQQQRQQQQGNQLTATYASQ
jgi:hypothetical protein